MNQTRIGLEFTESMSGWIGAGKADCLEGRIAGQQVNAMARMDAKIIIDDLNVFLEQPDHLARLEGTFTFSQLGGSFPIEQGTFNLFSVAPESGVRQMIYAFAFTVGNGAKFYLHGHKVIKDDPGFDVTEDMTTLYTTIYQGADRGGPVYGAGQIFFDLKDSAALLASMNVTGTEWLHEKIKAKIAFLSFAYGILRQEYFRDLNPLYDTEYENLVIAGQVQEEGVYRDFFLVSGVHDKDFPWGDGEIFSDILMVIGDEARGYRKFAMTGRVLEGLKLSVGRGIFQYCGPIYEIPPGSHSISFSEINGADSDLVALEADFNVRFDAVFFATTPLPFPVANNVLAKLATGLKWVLQSILPSEHVLGIFINPGIVTVSEGILKLAGKDGLASYVIEPRKTFGEAESTTFRNIKEPALLYRYVCAIEPDEESARVQINANSLRSGKQRIAKDQVDAFIGAAVSRVTAKEISMARNRFSLLDLRRCEEGAEDGAPPFKIVGEPLLEINNDHFPTAVFQRRIIRVQINPEKAVPALEENMNFMRLEAENSKAVVPVAAITHDEKIKALDTVLERTGFGELVQNHFEASGKLRTDYSIVIKPNFMFAYNKRDRSTYTDPELVEHLVEVLRDSGLSRISVAEAQSTYGEYFDKRSVVEMAEYLGYSTDEGKGYRIVDLTTDLSEEVYLGPHLGNHPVPLTWKNADFRISFAKNKTHCYAYYTLTLKNVYGALPLADKFREYHTGRDIYHTTMEYLKAYPVHYGLIDAYESADGPFGVFADSDPNRTKTIMGGANLVAVDWIGASKMGIDPKISKYMELAVKTFGKPKIQLLGNPNPYHPWLNVPVVLNLLTNYGIDADYYFGNLIYMTGAYMDASRFTHKSKSEFVKAARIAVKPIQEAVFLQSGGERTLANKLVGNFLTWLGSQ